MRATVVAPKSLSLPGSPLWDLVIVAATRGLKVVDSGDASTIKGIRDAAILDLTTVMAVVAAGGDVYEYPAMIKVTGKTTRNVPEYMPFAAETDEDGNETPRKWADWPRSTITDANGVDWVEAADGSNYVAGSVLKKLQGDGYTVQAVIDYVAPEPEEV